MRSTKIELEEAAVVSDDKDTISGNQKNGNLVHNGDIENPPIYDDVIQEIIDPKEPPADPWALAEVEDTGKPWKGGPLVISLFNCPG